MSDPNHSKLKRIFEKVVESAPADQAAVIDRECGDDAALKKRIVMMLEAAHDDRFLADPSANRPSSAGDMPTIDAGAWEAASEAGEQPGTRIGPYKLLQQIGEGGFGSVFMAEQEAPVRRRVALKIIKLGMDTRQVVARFEQERQALALMDHPNIARVYDAGATEAGRPFFVMELVKGDPIVAYCDKHNLSIDQRLDLFGQVCTAVQHAHTKGIIHRDIKPSNVLVSTLDGRPHPKIIDFGIAKATTDKLTEKTFFTEHRQLIGTPQYMSPEQAEGSLDIDTRTDVYSLGVLLYELLTGTTPFTRKELLSAAYAEMQRIIREVDPPRPSTRLSQSSDSLEQIATSRRTDPKRLGATIRGELDWIVMKALEKDRARRYETANGLEQDIRRYMTGEAVTAAPPSNAYRVRAFIRRHRVAVMTGSAVFAALFCGMLGTSWGMINAFRHRKIAETAQLSEVQQRQMAETRLLEAKATVDFLNDMLAAADPATQGKDVMVRDVLKRAAEKLGPKFNGRPLVAARLHGTISQTYFGLGDFGAAELQARRSLEICRKELGDEDAETCNAVNSLATILIKLARYDEAAALLKSAIENQERTFGRKDVITLRAIDALVQSLVLQSRQDEALPLAREVLNGRLAALGRENAETLSAMNTVALLQAERGDNGEAEMLYEEVLEAQIKLLGQDHPHVQGLRTNLALLHYQRANEMKASDPAEYQRRLSRARQLGELALEVRTRTLGDDHPDTLVSMNNLGSVYRELGLVDEGDRLAKINLELTIRKLGEDHPDTIVSLANMGSGLRNRKRYEEAIEYLDRALRGARKVHSPNDPGTGYILGWYGTCLRELGRYAEAEPLLIEGREVIVRVLGPGHHVARQMALGLAVEYEAWEKSEPGQGHAEKAAMWRAVYEPTSSSAPASSTSTRPN